jgi:hypothetical protein
MGNRKEPTDTTEPFVMPSEEIRVPAPAWSNPILEQNRFYIDIGLHLLLLALAISPFVVLYSKRKSPTGWLDLVLLVAACFFRTIRRFLFKVTPYSVLLCWSFPSSWSFGDSKNDPSELMHFGY